MFKLSLKRIKEWAYVYAQKSVRISPKEVNTISYSLGNVKEFIADLNTKISAGKIYTYTGEICLSKMAEKIRFRECVNKHFSKSPEESKYDLSHYLLTLAVHHILNPESKSKCIEWYQGSYMQHIVNLPEISFHKNNIYYYMDKFYKKRHKIFRSLRDSAISIIGISVYEFIFDTTSVVFRVAEFTVEDRFRRKGYSRDKRPDLLQFVVAVCTNGDGFPLYYRTYPGNTSDFHAFKNFLNEFDAELKPIHKEGIIWVVFDKGNTSKETLLKLDKISERFTNGYLVYVAATKLDKKMLDELEHSETCLVDDREYNVSEMFNEIGGGVKRVLIVYDPKLKDKQVMRLEKKYLRIKSEIDKILEDEKDVVKSISKMSEIIRKNKLTTVFSVEADGNRVTYREDKPAKERWFMKAHTFAILTNNFTASRSELISNYLGRNRIEQVIRELKDLALIRPVYHNLKKRIKTHVFIVMVGHLLLSGTKIYLQKKDLNMTMEKLLSVLQTGYLEIIKWSKTTTIEYPKNISEDMQKVFQKLGIPIPKF